MIDWEDPSEYRRYLQERNKGLEALRDEVWGSIYRDSAKLFLTRGTRFDPTQTDRPARNVDMISGVPRRALRTLAAGMQAGITSPSRGWIHVRTPDADLNRYRPVKAYLYEIQQQLLQLFAKCNFYPSAYSGYESLGAFGTSVLFFDNDFEDLLRVYHYPVGSYVLDTSSRWRINTMFRTWQMTVGTVVEAFGLEKCSERVRRAYSEGKYSVRVMVTQAVEPNRKRLYSGSQPAFGHRGMPYTACWFETNCTEAEPGFLRESGYDDFPVVGYRWQTRGEDVYGEGPALDAAGAAFALQKVERRKGQLVDKVTAPATSIPAALLRKKNSLSLNANERIFLPTGAAQQKLEPIYVPEQGALDVVFRYAQDYANEVQRDMFADLFMLIANRGDNGDHETATEIVQAHEERLLQLGPVYELLVDEYLDPTAMLGYNTLIRYGRLPPPPPEMEGLELRIEFISILTQAQRMLGAAGVERFLAFCGQAAGVEAAMKQAPKTLLGIDFGKMRDHYAEIVAVPPDILRDQREVDAELQAQQEQEQAAVQGQAALAAAQGAKDLSAAKLGDPNLLSQLMGQKFDQNFGYSPTLPPGRS
jgi:hypothetical protein